MVLSEPALCQYEKIEKDLSGTLTAEKSSGTIPGEPDAMASRSLKVMWHGTDERTLNLCPLFMVWG